MTVCADGAGVRVSFGDAHVGVVWHCGVQRNVEYSDENELIIIRACCQIHNTISEF